MRAKHRAKVDANQSAIVDELRKAGVSVETGHDDILCGWRGETKWYEIKDPDKLFLKDARTIAKGQIKPSQIKLLEEYQGHYAIVWSIIQIFTDMGIMENPSYEAGDGVYYSPLSAPITRENLRHIAIGK